MTAPLWQILIPTLKNDRRRAFLERLMSHLRPQLTDDVQAVVFADEGELSIGAKRDRMLREPAVTAPWVSQFDDDDLPAPDYVSRVLAVITSPDPPDVVGFLLRYYVDGREAGAAVHSYGAEAYQFPVMPRRQRWRRMNRLPNHLNPVRRELALRVGFKPLDSGEDSDYARRLAELKPREVFIPEYLYTYDYRRDRRDELTHAKRLADAHRDRQLVNG